MTKTWRILTLTLLVTTAIAGSPTPTASAQTSATAILYRDGHREAAKSRRAATMAAMEGGLAVITSADRSQPNLYEYFADDTESHDFTFLTGMYDPAPPGSILLLNPNGTTYREVLYTADSLEEARRVTGIKHVFQRGKFIEHLSSALTDYRNLRITQLRFKPVASDLARGWGHSSKVLYVNYPRFNNLGEPASPRLGFVGRLREATGELDVRDAGDILDRMRVVLDDFAQHQVRRAIEITGKGLMEAMKLTRPGLSTKQVMETIDYVYRLNGAHLGFITGVSPASNLNVELRWESTREEEAARKGDAPILPGTLVHFDTGAAFNHYSADIQRTVPADDTFTDQQRHVYQTVLDVQKTVISNVRPGVTWQELHDMAVMMLRDAGGWDRSYTYGIGHFIGMEVHEHGDYSVPLEPGMVLAIEQGAIVDGTRVAFEDDVLVTEEGHEWLSRFIPIEIDEVEALRREGSVTDPSRLLLPLPQQQQ